MVRAYLPSWVGGVLVGERRQLLKYSVVHTGVGGYDKIGIDSAFFSQGLCIGIASVARAAASADVNPENLLASGYVQTLQDKNIKGGAATACLGVYRRDGVLSTAKCVSRWESIEVEEGRGGGER